MKVNPIPIGLLVEAPWNPNEMDQTMLDRLTESIARYGLVVPLVVREIEGEYEVLSGNQRLQVLTSLGMESVPCVVAGDVGDADAMLLAQALNDVHGVDDIGAKAELVRTVLRFLPESSVLSILPESSDSLAALADLGQADIAEHLQNWQAAQAARLRHLTFQLVDTQRETVEEALDRAAAVPGGEEDGNPNKRGIALYQVCKAFLEGQR